ncbi:MAG: chemotaxis protein CheD [Gammaproteobacteria bacterium]|nr:chemotaxis protein CheD [Gammaproteobacteria bacterium]
MSSADFLYLMPGEIYFGKDKPGVKTLLGSCVAVTLWHPIMLIGGMCHITLPGTNPNDTNPKYAYGAINTFLKAIKQHRAHANEFIVQIYGGGKMTSVDDPPSMRDIGNKNVLKTIELIAHTKFRLHHMDVLDTKYRHVELSLTTGRVVCKATDVSLTMG